MAIRNPSQDEINKLLNKNVENVILKKDEIKEEKNNNINVVSINPNESLKPKKSRFEPDPIKCQLISNDKYVKDGFIYVRRLNTEEESRLANINDAETLNSAVNAIFETAIKSNVSIYEMPLIDKMYVFAFILGITYSDKITINELINCKTCNDDYPYEINFLKDLKAEVLSDTIDIPCKVTLNSFEDPYELCFTIPKIKNESNFYNRDISEIIASITLYLRDKNGVDVPKEEWIELMRWISNDDKRLITLKLSEINSYGENFSMTINDKCKNPNCCMKGESIKIKIDDLFLKLMNSISTINK